MFGFRDGCTDSPYGGATSMRCSTAMVENIVCSMTYFINITSNFIGQILVLNSTLIFQRTENINT